MVVKIRIHDEIIYFAICSRSCSKMAMHIDSTYAVVDLESKKAVQKKILDAMSSNMMKNWDRVSG